MDLTTCELTACPECGAPAEIAERHVIDSTDGPVEHAKVRCAARHWFFLPVASLAAPAVARDREPAAAVGRP